MYHDTFDYTSTTTINLLDYYIPDCDDWSSAGIMPKHNEYFIVEYRIPIKVDSVNSVQEAVSIASQIVQNQFGFKPENWNARVFQYSTDSNVPGYVKEFFYNPNSATFREITKNIGYHADLVKNNQLPEGVKKSKDEKDGD